MAGLVKAKKYEWQDSNLALFGSDLERNVSRLRQSQEQRSRELSASLGIQKGVYLVQVKKAAAETEPAWKEAGKGEGLQIWRIVKFNVCIYSYAHRIHTRYVYNQVKSWPKSQYGQFFNGDSYIILNTYKEEDGDVS